MLSELVPIKGGSKTGNQIQSINTVSEVDIIYYKVKKNQIQEHMHGKSLGKAIRDTDMMALFHARKRLYQSLISHSHIT